MNSAPRSLPIEEWPEPDRTAWAAACRPGLRLAAGGAASRLSEVSRESYANRYGAFLGFLQRSGRLRMDRPAGAQVTPQNLDAYIADLSSRVSTVTTYNAVSMLGRLARLIAPGVDLDWLCEIEKDLKLVVVPRSKLDRLVTADRLVEAGLSLIVEARRFERDPLARAQDVRNGLMIALLALCPIRLKNFTSLEIGRTFREADGGWWIVLPKEDTKTARRDERPIPDLLKPYVDLYLNEHRPVLAALGGKNNALWLSAVTGSPMTRKPVGTLISKITLQTLGVDMSPHLFRTAAASTAAAYNWSLPHLASALLNHTDPRVTEEHYNRNTSMNAARIYSAMVRKYPSG